jgi:hypothetical protein
MFDRFAVPLTATEATVAGDGDVVELEKELQDHETASVNTRGTRRVSFASLSFHIFQPDARVACVPDLNRDLPECGEG